MSSCQNYFSLTTSSRGANASNLVWRRARTKNRLPVSTIVPQQDKPAAPFRAGVSAASLALSQTQFPPLAADFDQDRCVLDFDDSNLNATGRRDDRVFLAGCKTKVVDDRKATADRAGEPFVRQIGETGHAGNVGDRGACNAKARGVGVEPAGMTKTDCGISGTTAAAFVGV
jgi:hypothetical protein